MEWLLEYSDCLLLHGAAFYSFFEYRAWILEDLPHRHLKVLHLNLSIDTYIIEETTVLNFWSIEMKNRMVLEG